MMSETSKSSGPVAVELRQVTKYYGQFKAVEDVSFALPIGSIYGFLGPNGAGKTTTIRMILEIIKPSSGDITVLGHRSALQVRQRIGYLPEEKGLKDFADKPTDALSKGMGQKVQVLASIAHDPELVILDEPFSGLDPVNQEVMEEIIRDMARRNRTVLFSTHVMEHAERLCDRILLMAKGRKIFDGTLREAKAVLPRRVRLETEDDVGVLREVPGVLDLSLLAPTNLHLDATCPGLSASGNGKKGVAEWELELRENSDPQAILQACFARGIRLRSFNQREPTLHEVFVRLVGAEAKEAGFR
jgi:ABC-2 type transport system ATP-binding protein